LAGANLVSLADALAFDPPLIGEEATKFVLTIGPGQCAIHPNSWKGNSAKFAFWGFSEVRYPQATSK
jgi:hypothetical protein